MNLFIDLETTIRCPVGTHKANPMWVGNLIVASGIAWDECPVSVSYDREGLKPTDLIKQCGEASMVIGHNIKFDLLYIYRATSNVLPRVWDTQLAAYLLSGQRHLYASLDELTAEYLTTDTLKDTEVKAYWKAGIDTTEIPETLLLPYLKLDVENTRAIFAKQWVEAEQLDILPLMFTQMDALRATIEMNRHGMRLDWDFVAAQRQHYGDKLTEAVKQAEDIAPDLDTASPKQLSLYYFGGNQKYKVKELVGTYLNGNDKFKVVEKVRVLEGKYAPQAEVGKSGYHSVDDSVLQVLAARGDNLAPVLLVIRETTKIKDTYYDGLNNLRFPNGNIYPNLNHTSTKTGRLSSTNPNLQNQTDTGDVKRAYVSRFKDGVILELDYAQLEMVALAYLSEDTQLIADINDGKDMHRELYKEMYGRHPTDKERKPFKRFSFLLVYGGGAATLMAQSGCDRATANKFIKTFYKRYKGVKIYHERIVNQANMLAVISYDPVKTGPKYTYFHTSPTGRHYIFNKYPSEYKPGTLSFSPTELKNWPIQGFATGDVVPMMVGILQRKLEEGGHAADALLVMTVHDSVILDVRREVLYTVAELAKKTLESAPEHLKSIFNIDFPCRLGVGVEAGINWQDTKELV